MATIGLCICSDPASNGATIHVAVTEGQINLLTTGRFPCPVCSKACSPKIEEANFLGQDLDVVSWSVDEWRAGRIYTSGKPLPK